MKGRGGGGGEFSIIFAPPPNKHFNITYPDINISRKKIEFFVSVAAFTNALPKKGPRLKMLLLYESFPLVGEGGLRQLNSKGILFNGPEPR